MMAMRAVVQTGYGDPAKVLSFEQVDEPTLGDDQVLVRVVATSVNSGDWRQVYASPRFLRLLVGLRRPKDGSLGGDVAGVVEKVGPTASGLNVGDEVYGIRHGAFAEYASGTNFIRKPANLSLREAATVPIAAVTALQALHKHGNVQAGDKVVVNGAGGGVGSFAIQIAKSMGAEVTAVTSTAHLEMVRTLGPDHVVDYSRDDFTRTGTKYDVIVEIGGDQTVGAMRRALSPTGRIILVGAGRRGIGVLGRVIGTTIRRRLGQPIKFFIATGPYGEQLEALRELIEAGKVRPVVDRTYSIDQIADAIRYAATEKTRGKVAISVGRQAT
jgi:NADPH:quinone reductase-like Zn-dependent oxidoreductase